MQNSAYVRYTIQDILESFKQPIPFEQPLYETIANSLEAGATEVIITLYTDDTQLEINNQEIPVIRRINGFILQIMVKVLLMKILILLQNLKQI